MCQKCPHLPIAKSCGHIWDCGCGKVYCANCVDEENAETLCDDENCKQYYAYRNDNCNCDDCGYCFPSLYCMECKEDKLDGDEDC